VSLTQLILFSAIVVLGGFIQGSTGMGFALLVAPVISLLRPDLLPVCVLVLMLPLSVYVVHREHRAVDRVGSAWISGGRLLGTFGGLVVLAWLSARNLSIFVGLSTIAAVAATWFMPAFTPGRGALVTAGLITGVTETATGIGGPPLALVYQHQPVAVMRSTLALCFLVGQVMSLVMLLAAGHVSRPQLVAAAELMPALAVGALLSHFVHHRINARFMRAFVQVFAVASGLVLLVRAF
jgi:uncharacterized membrane protein YfcA